jgi:tripartite-type tricarboxylate transporter receptor subunit TctC
MISRRTILFAAPALAAAGIPKISAFAQDAYPTRMIKIVIGNPPGGDDDTLSRWLAEKLTADLGQTVIVENRGGGATTVGGYTVASSEPDGYTILCLTTGGVVQTVLRKNLKYSLDDFAPIIGIGGYPMALVVSAASKITTIEEFITVAKSEDGITFANAGPGTLAHLTGVRFLNEIQGKGVSVGYKNNPEGLQALAGGFTQMMFPSAREASNLRGEDTLRVLAVTSKERTGNLPDVPTMTELGYPAIDSILWYGYMAPKGTPADVVAKLAAAITKGLTDQGFRDQFNPLSFQEDIKTGEALSAFMTAEAARWDKVITENNVRTTG